jgi:outer membrane protein insertion porin family
LPRTPAIVLVSALICLALAPGAAAQPVAGEPIKPLPLPDRDTLPVTGTEPPRVWTEFDIEGELLESAETVRAFLTPVMRLKTGALSSQVREEIAEFLRAIGYYLVDADIRRRGNGGSVLVLVLEPQRLVSRVDVDSGSSFWDLFRGEIDAVLSDEIVRRMRLRSGAALAHDPAARQAQLDAEEDRLEEYLQNQGYYDARVTMTPELRGRHEAIIDVDVDLGARYRIGRIQVTGNTAIPDEEIIEQFHHARVCILAGIFGDLTCFGDRPFSRQQLNEDVQAVARLYQRRGYPSVRVRTDFRRGASFKRDTKTVEFTVIVNERRKLDVIFIGDDALDESEVRDRLTFSEEGSYDEVEVRASAEAIRLWLQAQGYFEASVTWERLRFDFFDRIIYHVDRGPLLKVRQVRFEGNEQVPTSALRAAANTSVFESLALLGDRGGLVTSAQLAGDVGRLRELYRSRGFPDAAVRARVTRDERLAKNSAALAATIAAETPSDDLYVRYLINEGRQHLVESVRFELSGTDPGREERLRRLVSLRAGDPYYQGRAEEEKARIERYYFQQGHPHAKVEVLVETGPDPARHEVLYRVDESHPVRFGKVIVRGNFRTKDWVILDELGYDEGDLVTLSRAERGQQNLRTAGLFDAVQVGLIEFDNPHQEEINVLVQVEERHQGLGDGELAAGLSTDSGVFVETGFILPNLFGIGLSSSTRLTVGTEEYTSTPELGDFQAYFEEQIQAKPWITRRYLGIGAQAEASFYARREITERFGPLTSLGTTVGLSRAGRHGFFEGWLLSVRYDFRQRNRDEDLVRPPGASDDLDSSPVTTRTSAPAVQLVIDKRRDAQGRINPLAPVRGIKVDLRALFAEDLLLGSDSFIKLGASGQVYWKPAGRLLITNGLRYDHGIPLPLGAALLPEVERFFAGGDTTVRGFEEDRLATELIREPLPPYGDTDRIRVLPAGGNIRFVHNLDLQVNVWELGGFPVASAIFMDTGLVTNSLDGFSLTDLRHALGVALVRWLSPVGAFSVEWAVPLDPKAGDDPRGRFHFNFGLLIP